MMERTGPGERPFIALVVEDEPDLRSLAASLLEETELEVAEAENGEQALSFLRKRGDEVAMMFVDVNLGGRLDGIDLALAAAHSWPSMRVIVTTGGMERSLNDLPPSARFMPKPWRALDVLVEAEKAAAH